MSSRNSKFEDYAIDEDDPKIKFNSLISATVSTIMCLSAKCPLPRSNVETTKLFLSKITDDNGKNPRNVRGFLSLLNGYKGPYDGDTCKGRFEKLPEKSSMEVAPLKPKATPSQILSKEDVRMPTKRTTRILIRKTEKETIRKTTRNSSAKISPSRSIISSKT